MTANAEFKAEYQKYLQIGLLCALLIHAVAFAFWPEYVPGVYKLREERLEVFDIPPEIEEKLKDMEERAMEEGEEEDQDDTDA